MERRDFLLLAAGTLALLHTSCGGARAVNVRELGARGDGTSDDTDAIAAALQLASDSGGVVIVPAGTYRVVRTIAIRGELTLRGAGVKNTAIVFDGPAVQMASESGVMLTLERLRMIGGEPFADELGV